MSRSPRKKSPMDSYHIFSRSISEINLFQNDDDKKYYLSLLKKYIEKYRCSLYVFCLMDNHVHLFINTQGFDISIFMRCLNNAYVSYFNQHYQRHGHLFQGRFSSRIVADDLYSLTLSAYIHNNAKDLPDYFEKEDDYLYSSFGIYTGKRKDNDNFIDSEFLLRMFSNDLQTARCKYKSFVITMRDTGILGKIDNDIKEKYIINEYINERIPKPKELSPEKIIEKLCFIFGEKDIEVLKIKNRREYIDLRSIVVYLLRTINCMTYKEICAYLGNVTLSGAASLFSKGYTLFLNHESYKNIFRQLSD